jgi:hypothetical protein
MSKLTHQITVHLSQETHDQIAALCVGLDLSPSEYVRELLIAPHLDQKRVEFERMARVFGSHGSMGSPRSPGDE